MKRILVSFLLIIICIFSGCKNDNDVIKASEKEYDISFRDMGIVYPLSQEGKLLIHDDLCVFHSISYTPTTFDMFYYSIILTDESSPRELGIRVPAEGFVSDYLNDNINILWSIGDKYELSSYSTSGELIRRVEFEDPGFNRFPSALGVYEDDSFGVLNSSEIMIFDANCELQSIISDGKFIYKDIISCKGNDIMYVLANKLSKSESENIIMAIDKTGDIVKEVVIPRDAEGITADEKSIYYISGKTINKVNLEKYNTEVVLDYSEETINYSTLCNVIRLNNDYVIIKQDHTESLGDINRMIVFSPSSGRQMKEVTNLTLYDPRGISKFYAISDIVTSFNEDNPLIHVELKEYDKDINYVLSSNDKPDLMINYGNRLNELSQSDYMYDLSERLSKSDNLSEEDFLEGLLPLLKYNNGLYGLPRYVGIRTMGGVESKVGSKPGWSVDEFLDWLIERPGALEDSWMQKEDILRVCLEGSLNDYKDCDYSKLLDKVNRVTTYKRDGGILDVNADVITTTCSTFLAVSTMDSNYGERYVFKGFPSSTGDPRYILDYAALGILETSENKDEAYRFIEYYVKWKYGDPGKFYSTKELFNWAREASGTINLSQEWKPEKRIYMTEEQLDRPVKTLPYLTVLSDSDEEIIDIIVEESSPYFNGNKSLEETSDVIKQRVSILLEERK